MNTTTSFRPFGLRTLGGAAALALCLAANAADQRTFASPEEAVAAFEAALRADDEAALISIVGDKYKNLVVTGDPVADRQRRSRAAALLAEYRSIDDKDASKRFLVMGA